MLHILLSPPFLSLIFLFSSVLWLLRGESDTTRVLLFFGLLANVIYGSVLSALMGAMNSLLPWKYDYFLYRTDLALGVSTPAIARIFAPAALAGMTIVYSLMIPAMLVLYLFGAGKEQQRDVAVAYFSEMVFGPLLYAFLPACGPIYAFSATWPNVHAFPPLQTVKLAGMPNAFPSLHFGTALVMLAFARRGPWRILAVLFAAATAAATIVTGEHYVIDLAAGVSFACFACFAGRRRLFMASLFFSVTALYALMIRLRGDAVVNHPNVLRAAVVATCTWCGLSLAVAARCNRGSKASSREPRPAMAPATGTP